MVVHTYEEFPKGRDVQEFLDQAILRIMMERNVDDVLNQIGWVVVTLHRLFGDNALIPPDGAPEDIARRFSLRALEGIAVGLARNKDAILALDNRDDFIRTKVSGFWAQQEVAEMSASGLRGSVRLQRSIPFGAAWFNPNA